MPLNHLGRNSQAMAPKRSGLLRDQVQLVKRKNCNRYEIAPITEVLSFEKGFFVVIRACQLLSQHMDGVIIVGIAGPSGAGKTVFTEKMLNFMPSIVTISMDNYNDSSRVIDRNFDDPRLTDYDTLLENMHDLKSGKSVQVPIYDFKQSCRIGYRTVEVPSSRIVILEGIYALSETLRPVLDLRVSITGGVHFDLVKRVLRDIHRAGQEPEEIIHQISETVYPMYKAFIEPDLQTAHIKIKNKFNPFSGFQTPTYILKSLRTLTEEQIRGVISPDHIEATEETYDIYLLPPGEDPEACQSYLRMRNRDGKYSLMFEEWVTDTPFIISPRITFEVSVRLLGGLMALGYTIATILKRRSRVFSDNRVCIKIDWLEQLDRKYFQVQGKDRATVRDVAKQLGLEGSYIPRTYIEQIQLEKLLKEVMAMPEDLKTKLSIDEDFVTSPNQHSSGIISAKATEKPRYSRSLSWSRDVVTDITASKPSKTTLKRYHIEPLKLPIPDVGNERSNRMADSPALFSRNQELVTRLSDQISTLNERLDEVIAGIERVGARLGTINVSSSQQNLTLQAETSALTTMSAYLVGGTNIGMNNSLLHASASTGHITTELSMNEEVALLLRGQQQIGHQVDILSNLLQENLEVFEHQRMKENRKYFPEYISKNQVVFTAATMLLLSAIGSALIKSFKGS